MRYLTIHKNIFTKADCYTRGTIQNQYGVQVHSTGANNPNLKRYVQPDDGLLGKNIYNNSHNNPGGSVCANAYIGKLADGTVAVYQTLPWYYRTWLSGSGTNGNANKLGYIGFEICEDNLYNEAYFQEAVMDKAVLLTAHLCLMFNIQPDKVIQYAPNSKAFGVMDHEQLHDAGLASNHGDIKHWLRKYNLTFEDFRKAVIEAMNEGITVTYVDSNGGDDMQRTLRKGDTGGSVVKLQDSLNQLGGYQLKTDGIFGKQTETAVADYQLHHDLEADGVVCDNTWNIIEKELETKPIDNETITLPYDIANTFFEALKTALNK